MKKTFFSLVVAAIAAFNLNAGEINVFAAANVTYAFDELKAEFAKSNPGTKVTVTLGASGALSTQVKNGAPADVFMAANMKFVQDLYDTQFAVTEPVVYAQGALALFTIRDIDLAKGINAVEGLKAIAIANPETAPYGKASIEALKNAKIYDKVEKNIVISKSIGDALSQALSAADVGFIAASAMHDKKMAEYKEGKNFVLIDPKLYTPIDQGMVILKHGENNPEAKAFYDFIRSDRAKEIFRKFGYVVP